MIDMRIPTKDTWMCFFVVLAAFWLGPLILKWISTFSHVDSVWESVLMVVVLPVISISVAWFDSVRHGFGWWWLFVPAVAFFSTAFVFYDFFSWGPIAFFVIVGLVGTSIGAFIRHLKRYSF